MLISLSRPPVLIENWKAECARFFPSNVLTCRDFTIKDFIKRTPNDVRTIWLWSSYQLTIKELQGLILDPKVRILVCAADESHTFLKSKASDRSREIAPVIQKSEMMICTSGTLFPLGPKTDGLSTLTMMGGDLKTSMKWSKCKVGGELRKLFKLTEREFMDWDVGKFRKLITPFHLRRDRRSRWLDRSDPEKPVWRWVIPRSRARPNPATVKPGVCVQEELALKNIQRLRFDPSGKINMNDVALRSTHALQMAWLGVDLWKKVIATTKIIERQRMIADHLQDELPTARLKELGGIIRTIVEEEKEKFCICAESIVLIELATYVLSHNIKCLIVVLRINFGLKGGCDFWYEGV